MEMSIQQRRDWRPEALNSVFLSQQIELSHLSKLSLKNSHSAL
jgi:hypothetical protein